jgi:hypothetical protein
MGEEYTSCILPLTPETTTAVTDHNDETELYSLFMIIQKIWSQNFSYCKSQVVGLMWIVTTIDIFCVYDIIHTKYTNCIYSASWWWANKCSIHVEAINHNTLKAKPVHLVGPIVLIYYDAWTKKKLSLNIFNLVVPCGGSHTTGMYHAYIKILCNCQWHTDRGEGGSKPPKILKFWWQSWAKFPVPLKIHP